MSDYLPIPGSKTDPFSDYAPGTGESDPFFGGAGAAAAKDAADQQEQAAIAAMQLEREGRADAQKFFKPFAGAARRGVRESGFLANPQAQFKYLQNNPLFKLALDNANRQTNQSAAASGRLNAGDTLSQLSNNVLLSASPLIDRQREDVNNLLNFGAGIAGARGNLAIGEATNLGGLTTDVGNVQAAGTVGAANAQAQGGQNLLSTGLGIAGLFASDERLKTNKKKIGEKNGYDWYSWDWNEIAGEIMGLFGSSEGVMAQEVIKTNPNAVVLDNTGYYKVNYGVL